MKPDLAFFSLWEFIFRVGLEVSCDGVICGAIKICHVSCKACFSFRGQPWNLGAFPQPEERLFVNLLMGSFDDPSHPVSNICG